MPSFYQPRPRPGFLIDTSSSMQNAQLSRAVAELGGLTRQLGYGSEVVVACCDAAVHHVQKVFNAAQLQMYGGGGTNIAEGLRYFIERQSGPIDLLVIVSDCETAWPDEAPPFPVITVRVGDGAPPAWAIETETPSSRSRIRKRHSRNPNDRSGDDGARIVSGKLAVAPQVADDSAGVMA
jgi:hypothetical protein